MSKFQKIINNIEKQIDDTKSPLKKTYEPFFDNSYYESDFRNCIFQFHDPPFIKYPILINKKGETIRFRNLCVLLRMYIIQNKLNKDNGLITCDPFIQDIINDNSSETSFFKLIAGLRRVLV
jgi:hypothetical protein